MTDIGVLEEVIADLQAWAEDDIVPGDLKALLRKVRGILEAQDEELPALVEYEYWWKSDIWSPHSYETKELAEEYMGNPKRFRRIKSGPWEEADGN